MSWHKLRPLISSCCVLCVHVAQPRTQAPTAREKKGSGIHCLRMCLISSENHGLPCYIGTTMSPKSCTTAMWSVQLSWATREFDDWVLTYVWPSVAKYMYVSPAGTGSLYFGHLHKERRFYSAHWPSLRYMSRIATDYLKTVSSCPTYTNP